jgi:DNA anti-recombination protein RmuC
MNRPILLIALAAFMTTGLFQSCNQSSSNRIDRQEDKLLDEKQDVEEASQDLNQAVRDSVREFKLEAQNQISENNRKIDDLKEKIANGKKSARDKYEGTISDLERKNKELQKRLDEFNAETADNWTSFKREFSHDMDELGNSLKDITVDNVD